MSEIPNQLPPGLEAYGRSPDFTTDTLPPRLQSAHSTKPGTWGLLHVVAGRVRYVLEAPRSGEAVAAAGETVVIEPEVAHHVEFVEPGSFFIEFHRVAKGQTEG
jgi:hemoglobin